MLLQFSVTSHRSIKDTAIISMKAAADKTMKEILISPDGKKELVPVMAIYGTNAAGKSNVIHALLLMREMVCGSYANRSKVRSFFMNRLLSWMSRRNRLLLSLSIIITVSSMPTASPLIRTGL